MKTNYEDWKVEEWLNWFRKRETVMELYFNILTRYRGLPASSEMVNREMCKRVGKEMLELAYETIIPPVYSITHTWTSAPNYSQGNAGDGGEAYFDEDDPFFTTKQGEKLEELSERNIKIALAVCRGTIRCMSFNKNPGLNKTLRQVHKIFSNIVLFFLAANDAIHGHFKNKALALLMFNREKAGCTQALFSSEQYFQDFPSDGGEVEEIPMSRMVSEVMKVVSYLIQSLDEYSETLKGTDLDA